MGVYAKHEDNSFTPDDARAGCRIGVGKANDGLRAGQRAENALRSPRKRRSCGKDITILDGWAVEWDYITGSDDRSKEKGSAFVE